MSFIDRILAWRGPEGETVLEAVAVQGADRLRVYILVNGDSDCFWDAAEELVSELASRGARADHHLFGSSERETYQRAVQMAERSGRRVDAA